jgi:RNA 2',3'-cyclic 3'-phosphodiesterase
MRLFVGIPLGDAVVHDLTAVVARLRGGARTGGLRWSEPESWHITLQFLGSTSEERFRCLTARLGEVNTAPVPVQLGEIGCFDRAGVLFVDVAVTPGLAALQERVLAATSHCGFVAETRPFHPHITLARAKGQGRGAGLHELPDKVRGNPTFARFTAREFLLYESHLGSGGSRYEVKARFSLADCGQ